MQNKFDLQILNQTHFDSGALSGLGAVVHRMMQPGDHQLTILHGDSPVESTSLRVLASSQLSQPDMKSATAAQASGPAPQMELHVNLGTAVGNVGQLSAPIISTLLEIAAQGYVLFHAPPASAGFAVLLNAPGTQNQPPAFDSRQLGNSDVYATTLLRPGLYSVTNATSGAKGQIRVAYPVVGDTPYRPPDPMDVQVTDQGFQPATIQLKPAQGVVFHIGNTRARIQIDLVEPDDGPKVSAAAVPESPKPVYRWEKPMPPENK